MANRPGRRTKTEAPPRVNSETFEYIDDSIDAMLILARDENFPLVDIAWIKLVRGTDGGMSVHYSAKGQQYTRHVTAEEIDARRDLQVHAPDATQQALSFDAQADAAPGEVDLGQPDAQPQEPVAQLVDGEEPKE